MINAVLYFVGQEGVDTAMHSLEFLHPKTLARSLALIDLLEESTLPTEIDKLVCPDKSSEPPHPDQKASKSVVHGDLRLLKAKMGKTKLRFAYTHFSGQAVVIASGEQTKGQQCIKLVEDFERSQAAKAKTLKNVKTPALKSHRELVAELTLSDPILAAYYTKARERTQFALSLIRLRDNASLSNEDLAQRTGLTPKLVTRLTRGRLPNLETMRRLADALQARVVIGPAGGIVLEADEPLAPTTKRYASSEKSHPAIQADPNLVTELLLVQ